MTAKEHARALCELVFLSSAGFNAQFESAERAFVVAMFEAAKMEREACAKAAETHADEVIGDQIAVAIRARGQ